MNKIRYGIVLLTIVLLLSLMITSCGTEKSKPDDGIEVTSVKIGVLLYRFDDQFIQSLISVMSLKAREIEATSDIDVRFEFVDAKNQQDIQDDQLNDFIDRKFDALAINLVDRNEASKVIDLAKNANIPIVFFNRQPVEEDMSRWDRIYYVGTEGEAAGIIQGHIISDYVKANPEVDKNEDGVLQYVMLQGQVGHQDALLRSKYSIEFLEEADMAVEELASDTANWQRQEAKEKMSIWLDIFGDEIEFIISNNDAMAIGAIDAMKEKELPLTPVVGVDAISIAIKALEEGEMVGTVLNDAGLQGKSIINIAYYLSIDENPTNFIEEIKFNKYLWVPYQRIVRE